MTVRVDPDVDADMVLDQQKPSQNAPASLTFSEVPSARNSEPASAPTGMASNAASAAPALASGSVLAKSSGAKLASIVKNSFIFFGLSTVYFNLPDQQSEGIEQPNQVRPLRCFLQRKTHN